MLDHLKFLLLGISKVNEEEASRPHKHLSYQLSHILRGTFVFDVGGKTYTAGVGDTIFIPMNTLHSLAVIDGGPGYYYEVKFSSFLRQETEVCDQLEVVTREDKFSGSLLKQMFDEEEHATASSPEARIAYLRAILFKLSTAARRMDNVRSKYIEVATYSVPVQDTIRFLEDHYAKRLSLDDIVAQTAIGKSALSTRFVRETSVTIFECLTIIRIRKAAELLSRTEMTLAEVSQATGFVSLTHFNRVFTRYIKLPPGQYRKYFAVQPHFFSTAAADGAGNPITLSVLDGKKIDFTELAACQQ